jgi:hypothetical protein
MEEEGVEVLEFVVVVVEGRRVGVKKMYMEVRCMI